MISLLCPSRGRPGNIERFARSAHDTATGDVEVVFYVDDDDSESKEPASLYGDSVVIGPRLILSECWNRCAAAARGEILGHMGDDIVFRTTGWDALVAEAFDRVPDRIAFIHGCDGVHDERLGTHGFVHRRWVEAVGRFTPDCFAHDYCDTWFTDVADMIGRRVFLPRVVTEHMHPDVGKADYDATYREHAEAGDRDNVAARYQALRGDRERDAQRLKAAFA